MIKKLKIGLLIAVLSLTVGIGSANAANLTWDAAATIDMSSPDFDDVTIASGSVADTLVVNVGTIVVTADATDTFTVSSASRTLVPSSTTGVTQTCTSGVSQIVITAGTSALTISTTAPQCGTGGSTGGGITPADTTPPTNTSVSINAGATTTSSLSATLTLAATGATQVLVSNDSGFAGASWENFSSTSKAWTLTSGDGVKTVYVKFRDAAGNMSSAVSDTITVAGSGTVNNLPPIPEGGCSAGNLYNASTGALCVNNAGAQIPGCGNRTTGFSSATGVSCANNRPAGGTPNAPGASGYNFGTGAVKQGTKGEACKAWQNFLNAKRNAGLVVDGNCGPRTIGAAKAWQTVTGLTADGILGVMSRAKAMMQ